MACFWVLGLKRRQNSPYLTTSIVKNVNDRVVQSLLFVQVFDSISQAT